MKFFEAQKRAAFAAKLFTNAGLDFDALVEANNPDALKAALSATDALFATAGLDRAALVAAGPDALKLHIDGLTNDEAMAEALLENERLEAELGTAKAAVDKLSADFGAIKTIATTIGLTDSFEASQVSAAFADHVAKATTRALATTGHPPAHVPASTEPASPILTDEQIAAEYSAMPPSAERLAFFGKHEAALRRAEAKAKRTA